MEGKQAVFKEVDAKLKTSGTLAENNKMYSSLLAKVMVLMSLFV